jgi:cytochrome P450
LSLVSRIRRDILGFYAEMQRKYGDMVYMRLGPYRDYTVFHPDLIRELLVTKARCFEKMPWQRRVFAQWNGNSILLSEGDFWLRQRRLVQPAFHPRRLQNYAAAMVNCTTRLLNGWQTALAERGQWQIDVVKAMTDLTIEIIAKTLFDADVAGAARQLGEAVSVLNDVAMYEIMYPIRLPDWVPRPYVRRKRWAIQVIDTTVRGLIRERRASGQDHGDLLSMLLLAVDQEGDGQGMTDEQVRNEAVTLLLAGHDTTAAALSWVFYLLAKHPEAAARVREEMGQVIGDRLPAGADVARLHYTERFLKETMRLYPPAIGVFARQAVTDVEIGGYTIKKGGVVRALSYPVHHDARWFPDPERFDPDRFLPERMEEVPQYAYFPFGGGPRVCIGNNFALMEMTLIVATVLQGFELQLAPQQQEPRLSVMLSLRPKGGLWMTVEPRAAADRKSLAAVGSTHGGPA